MVKVVPYASAWKDLFQKEKSLVQRFVGQDLSLYHIGSTSIEGLDSKPVIDMILSVPDLMDFDARLLESCGYKDRGELVIPFRRVFQKKNESGERTHFIHVFEEGDPQIQRNLTFQKHLRENLSSLQEYAQLKRDLSQEFSGEKSFWNYTRKKSDFIESCLKKEEFRSLIFNRAYADSEWDAFNRLHTQNPHKDSSPIPKQLLKEDILSNTSSCFILSSEGVVVGGFWVEHKKETVFLRTFSLDPSFSDFKRASGYALFMIEKWAALRGASFLQGCNFGKKKSIRPLKNLLGFPGAN